VSRAALLLVLATTACGGSSEPAASPSSASPATNAAGADDTSQTASGPFDRSAAAKALAAVDVSPCYEKPPILDAQLHTSWTHVLSLWRRGFAAHGHGPRDVAATEQHVACPWAATAPISEVTPTTTRDPAVVWFADWSRR
jgi:hypothetical protein